MVQMNCVDMNAWYSRVDKPERPDYVVFDLDPDDDAFESAIPVAHLVREALEELDLRSYVKTSGAAGIHVLVPIMRRYGFDETYEFAERVSRGVESREPGARDDGVAEAQAAEGLGPGRPSPERPREDDRVRVLGAAEAGAPVSTPLRWEELTPDVRPTDFACARSSSGSSATATSTSRCSAEARPWRPPCARYEPAEGLASLSQTRSPVPTPRPSAAFAGLPRMTASQPRGSTIRPQSPASRSA